MSWASSSAFPRPSSYDNFLHVEMTENPADNIRRSPSPLPGRISPLRVLNGEHQGQTHPTPLRNRVFIPLRRDADSQAPDSQQEPKASNTAKPPSISSYESACSIRF
ncbi:MAG: hypothetical protein LLF94_00445 [Chlamydiales bacterium]|nr:hypothetical protein [Chlamydiales bacterium]